MMQALWGLLNFSLPADFVYDTDLPYHKGDFARLPTTMGCCGRSEPSRDSLRTDFFTSLWISVYVLSVPLTRRRTASRSSAPTRQEAGKNRLRGVLRGVSRSNGSESLRSLSNENKHLRKPSWLATVLLIGLYRRFVAFWIILLLEDRYLANKKHCDRDEAHQ